MKLKVYSVYDSKVECYFPPVYYRARGEAYRAFEDDCRNEKTNLYKHPEDYTFFELGEFDDSNALFTLHEAKIPICTALEAKAAS